MLIIGGGIVVLLYIFLRAAGSKKAAPLPASIPAGAPQSQGSDLSSFAPLMQAIVTGINDQAAALAKIGQNQLTAVLPNFTALGAESWLSCIPAGDVKPDATCIKSHQLGQAGVLPPGTNTGDIRPYANNGIYSSCKKPDGSFDLQCVGYLIAGKPSFNAIGLSGATADSTSVTRQPNVTRPPAITRQA